MQGGVDGELTEVCGKMEKLIEKLAGLRGQGGLWSFGVLQVTRVGVVSNSISM